MKDIIDAVNAGGVVALLLIILLGGVKQWWVFGWIYEAEVAKTEKWERLALRGTDLSDRATSVAETVVKK